MTAAAQQPVHAVGGTLALLLAVTAGFGAACLYFNQPLLPAMARDLGVDTEAVGMIPVLTQLGYGLGLVFLVPLGDLIERKRLMLVLGAALTLALAGQALAPGLRSAEAAALCDGVLASLAQQAVSLVAHVAPAPRRGRMVGNVMLGLLLGILLSRTISGALGEWLGWRTVFAAGGGAMTALLALLAWRLPHVQPTVRLGYGALLASGLGLLRRHAVLRRAVMQQAMLFGGFAAFWSTVGVMLQQPPMSLGSAGAGMLGIAGAGGALAAPLVGRTVDRRSPSLLIMIGVTLAMVSFMAMGVWRESLVAVAAGAVFMDVGVQGSMVANQARVYTVDPAARGRITGLLVGGMFAISAVSSTLAAHALAVWGWVGVCTLCVAFCLGSAAVELVFRRGDSPGVAR